MFALSVLAAVACAGVFLWHDTDFWDSFDVAGVLRVAAAVLGGMMVSSGLLFFHFARQESYTTFEKISLAFGSASRCATCCGFCPGCFLFGGFCFLPGGNVF